MTGTVQLLSWFCMLFCRLHGYTDSWPSTWAGTLQMNHPAAVRELQVELGMYNLQW